MAGQLQVRQGSLAPSTDVPGRPSRFVQSWGPWHDVLSPGWLVGFVLPHNPFVYEFRNAPEEEGQ